MAETPTPPVPPNDITPGKKEKPRWLLPLIVGIVAFLVGVGAGGADTTETAAETPPADTSELDAALEQNQELAAEISVLQDELEAMEEQVDEARSMKADLRAKERKLSQREKDVSGAERQADRNTFGDGVWQVGTDIAPGTYRAPAGSNCYWAILESPGSDNIRNNGGFSANQTVTLTDAWFETTGCGEWTKIG